jgi:hypothetical protein
VQITRFNSPERPPIHDGYVTITFLLQEKAIILEFDIQLLDLGVQIMTFMIGKSVMKYLRGVLALAWIRAYFAIASAARLHNYSNDTK